MSNFRNRQSAEILGSVYKNAEMAYEASGEVLKHCANRKLAGVFPRNASASDYLSARLRCNVTVAVALS